MPYGYCGKVLHVNLTTGGLTVEEPEAAFYRKYMGGSAMGAYYLLKHTPAHADPLGPENTLSLFVGPMTGARDLRTGTRGRGGQVAGQRARR